MKEYNINLKVTLDDKKQPQSIRWEAEDQAETGYHQVEAVNLALWDTSKKDMMTFDLWTPVMPQHEMKMFHLNMLGSMAQSILKSTGDDFMSDKMSELCDVLYRHILDESKQKNTK